jgi:hypothetical protein
MYVKKPNVKINQNHQMFIFGFDVAKDTGGIKLYTSYLVYSQIWAKIFLRMIVTFSTSSSGRLPLSLQTKLLKTNIEILTCLLFEIRTCGCLVNFISFSRVPIDAS